jgi:RNA recognition motif-containing protein
MPNVLYVANLAYGVGRDEVLRLFGAHGDVRWAELIHQFSTPHGTGAALVEMASPDGAAAAIEALHGAPLRGGLLIVGRTNEQQPALVERYFREDSEFPAPRDTGLPPAV